MIFCLKFETKGSVSLTFSEDMQIMWSVKNWMMASPLLKLLKLLKLGHRGTFRKKENCNSLNILRTKSPQRASFKNDIVIVDQNRKKLRELQDRLDIAVVHGHRV